MRTIIGGGTIVLADRPGNIPLAFSWDLHRIGARDIGKISKMDRRISKPNSDNGVFAGPQLDV